MFIKFLAGATQFLLLIGIVSLYRFARDKIRNKFSTKNSTDEEHTEKHTFTTPVASCSKITSSTAVQPTQCEGIHENASIKIKNPKINFSSEGNTGVHIFDHTTRTPPKITHTVDIPYTEGVSLPNIGDRVFLIYTDGSKISAIHNNKIIGSLSRNSMNATTYKAIASNGQASGTVVMINSDRSIFRLSMADH